MTIHFDGEPLFSTVQATWNLLAQEAGEALSEASDSGMGVTIKEALANGRLTTRNRESSFADKRTMLDEVAALNETTIDAVALAAVINQPWVDVVLSGAATVEQLHSNIRALDIKDGFETDELQQYMKESPAFYWTKRSRLAWN
jgi:aryl-alcohol dehydrogenase-like predicted oxidoreductase